MDTTRGASPFPPEVPDDPLHGLEATGDPLEGVRAQLAFLEDGLDAGATGAAAGALLDEAYRAAHVIAATVDGARLAPVARMARHMQALVRATRAGAVAAGPGLFTLLRAAARAARDALDGEAAGLRAAGQAADALDAFLRGAAAPAAGAPGSAGVRFEKVDRDRLAAALAATGALAESGRSLARLASEAAADAAQLASRSRRREEAAAVLMSALPEGLAAAAQGEPVTAVAARLAERFSSYAGLASDDQDVLSRLCARVRETAEAATRSVMACSAAMASLQGVSLDKALHGAAEAARRAGRALARPVEVDELLASTDVDATAVPLLRSIVLQTAKALVEAAAASSRRRPALPLKVLLKGVRDGDDLVLALSVAPGSSRSHPLGRLLDPVRLKAVSRGWVLTEPLGDSAGIEVKVTLPARGQPPSKEVKYLLARAGRDLVAVPSASVVEVLECRGAADDAPGGRGTRQTIVLGTSGRAGPAVIVREGSATAVLVVDAVIGEETMTPPGKGAAEGRASRADGSHVRIFDLGALAVVRPKPRPRAPARKPSGSQGAAKQKARVGKPPARTHAARKPPARAARTKHAAPKPPAKKAPRRK